MEINFDGINLQINSGRETFLSNLESCLVSLVLQVPSATLCSFQWTCLI